MAHHRFHVAGMQIPCLPIDFRLVDRHPHAVAEMFRPCGYLILQTKHAALIQTLIEPALERAVAAKSGLHLLHENSKLLSIVSGNKIVDRDGDRTLVVVRENLQVMRIVERRFVDMSLDWRN